MTVTGPFVIIVSPLFLSAGSAVFEGIVYLLRADVKGFVISVCILIFY